MGATMLMFRGFLIIFLAGLVGYTIAVIANHGWDLLSVFFGDMAAMGWPGQFNLDFLGFLALSALWVTWRHGFSPTGFALARDLGEEAEVLTLGVLPEARRHGVGRALLDAVLVETRRRGLASIVLEVAADNGEARRLYAGCGFRQVGRRPRYYRRPDGMVEALILRLGLPSEAAPG